MPDGIGGNDPEQLMRSARAGNKEALGRLLEHYRSYLWLLSRTQIGRTLQPQLARSDLVQETLLRAQQHFETFAGDTERKLVAWLRRILVRRLADELRHHQRCRQARLCLVSGFAHNEQDAGHQA